MKTAYRKAITLAGLFAFAFSLQGIVYTASAENKSKAGLEQVYEQLVKGRWATPMMDAIIEITPCGDNLCADLVAHEYEADTDIKNPNPEKRTRPLIGVRILEGLRRVKPNRWAGGVFYDPRTGKSYGPKIKVIDADHVKISGCIGPGLCKGYVWTRAK